MLFWAEDPQHYYYAACSLQVGSFLFADDDIRVSLTEINLTPAEFDGYQVAAASALTFCLKELRVSPTNNIALPCPYSAFL